MSEEKEALAAEEASNAEEVVEEIVAEAEGQKEEQEGDTGRVAKAIRDDYQSKIDAKDEELRRVEYENQQLKAAQQPQQQESSEDDDELVTRAEMRSQQKAWQRQAVEDSWVVNNSSGVSEIKTHLPDILKQKPWLVDAIAAAPNRYEASVDIVRMYKPKESGDGKRIVENAGKPGNPAAVGRSGTASNVDKLKNMSREEFRAYRKQVIKTR